MTKSPWPRFGPPGTTERPSRVVRSLYASIGLLYLIFPIADISHHSGWKALAAGFTVVAFAVVYLATSFTAAEWDQPVNRISWVLLSLAALVTVIAPAAFGGAWGGLYIYQVILFVMILPRAWVFRAIVLTTAAAVLEAAVLGARGSELVIVTITTGSLGVFMAAFRNSRILNHELRKARDEVARLAASEERLRIARDLHDLLGHSLSLIVLKSEVAKRLGERDPVRGLQEVEDIESVARQALADVREAISGYRQRNFTEELDNARAVLEAAGLRVSVQLSGTPLPDTVDGLFGWAVREGVTNVIRHSRAASCQISVRRVRSEAELTIVDDGPTGAEFTGPGNGLTGLAERIEAAGGTFTAVPADGGGFRLSIRAPLKQNTSVKSSA